MTRLEEKMNSTATVSAGSRRGESGSEGPEEVNASRSVRKLLGLVADLEIGMVGRMDFGDEFSDAGPSEVGSLAGEGTAGGCIHCKQRRCCTDIYIYIYIDWIIPVAVVLPQESRL